MAEDGLPARYVENCTAELARLNRKRDSIQKIEKKFKDDVLRLATTFDQMEIDSDRLKTAKTLFEQGLITLADAVLNARSMLGETEFLISKRSRLQRSQVEIDSLLRFKAHEWLIKAQITKTRYDLANWGDSVHYYFQQSIACRASYENLISFAKFLYDQHQLDSSEFYFNRIKQEHFVNLPAHKRVSLLLGLGNIHHQKGEFELSEVEYHQSLTALQDFPKEDSTKVMWYKSIIESNLGVLYKAQRKYKASEESHLKSLEALSTLVTLDSVRWREDLAATLNN